MTMPITRTLQLPIPPHKAPIFETDFVRYRGAWNENAQADGDWRRTEQLLNSTTVFKDGILEVDEAWWGPVLRQPFQRPLLLESEVRFISWNTGNPVYNGLILDVCQATPGDHGNNYRINCFWDGTIEIGKIVGGAYTWLGGLVGARPTDTNWFTLRAMVGTQQILIELNGRLIITSSIDTTYSGGYIQFNCADGNVVQMRSLRIKAA